MIDSSLMLSQQSMSTWAYAKRNSVELDVYTGCCRYPAQTQLASFWAANHRALMEVITEVGGSRAGLVLLIDVLFSSL